MLPHIFCLLMGFSGVGSISLHAFGWLPIHISALALCYQVLSFFCTFLPQCAGSEYGAARSGFWDDLGLFV